MLNRFCDPGNNEGTAYTPLEFEAAYEGRKFESLFRMSNKITGEVPPFAKEVHFETVTTAVSPSLTNGIVSRKLWSKWLLIEEPMDALKRLVPTLAAGGHQIILLSH